MAFENFFDESEACALPATEFAASVEPLEDSKNSADVFLPDTDAIITNVENRFAVASIQGTPRDARGIAIIGCVSNFYPSFLFVVVLEGVSDEITEHFTDAHRVASDSRKRSGDTDGPRFARQL